MDEIARLFLTAQREFNARVEAITPDQWDGPTVDDDWDVGALVDHLIDENRWLAPLLGGRSLEEAGDAVAAQAAAEADRQAAWRSAATAAAEVVSADGALDGEVALSRGPTPAAEYLSEMTIDHTIHAWDLGTAIGSDRPLPDELVTMVYSMLEPLGDLSKVFDGMFAPPVQVPDDAPLVDKLVALTGRNPGGT